ncbi:hypothetical protein [Phreatobacter sp.]|uniref:hypothetical protein n=1 Tax=Phreatobacter sp. TaxID=1966341 RepID=UPI0022BBC286|nr:hypothetical protein [Phreatobacter sp.]MCZ8313701.1 hypothetical protein [Phreatobacter sp.]
MTSFKTLAVAALFALSAGSAMAQTAGGGAGGSDGGAGATSYDPPAAILVVPGVPQQPLRTDSDSILTCRYELLRGRFCETYHLR